MRMLSAALLLLLLVAGCASGPSEPMSPEEQAQRIIWAQALMNGTAAFQQRMTQPRPMTCFHYGTLGMTRCQ